MSKLDFPVPQVFKYQEDLILNEFRDYLKTCYGEHYKTDKIECFDAWMALGDATPTFRNTAIKYLWRYGKKHHHGAEQLGFRNEDKKDLFKAMHYVLMMMYNEFYKDQ